MGIEPPKELKEVVEIPRRGVEWFFEELRYLCRVIVSASDRFYWDNGFSRAASLAYTTLLSLVPLTTLSFAFLASFPGLMLNRAEIRSFIFRQFVPNASAVDSVLQKLNDFSETVISLNIVVVPFIVITSILLINSIEYAVNQIWQVYEPRTIAHRIAIFCAIIVIAPILAISAYYTTQQRVGPMIEGFMSQEGYVDDLYHFLLPLLIDFLAFVSLYYLVPKAPVHFRSASFGAFFAAILFGVAKGRFAYYISNFTSYEAVYGTLAAIPIFLFWLYLAWAIVLFGAEISYQAQYLPRTGKLWKRTLLSIGDGRLVLGVQSLVIVARAFLSGARLPSDLEIAEKLGCSSVVLKPTLDALKKADIIARGDSRDMAITLRRSPEKITLAEVHEALFQPASSVHFPQEMSQVFEGFVYKEGASTVTLADIIKEQEK